MLHDETIFEVTISSLEIGIDYDNVLLVSTILRMILRDGSVFLLT